MGRILSLLISISYLIIAYIFDGGEAFLRCLMFLLLPLACIWFGEEMGNWTGFWGYFPITSKSPGWLVKFLGWVLLLLPAIIAIFIFLF